MITENERNLVKVIRHLTLSASTSYHTVSELERMFAEFEADKFDSKELVRKLGLAFLLAQEQNETQIQR